MNIATSTMKVGVLDVSDLSGAGRTGRTGTLEWDGSWLSIPLQLLLCKHLGLPVWIDQGADLCGHLFFHKGAHLERNLEAFFLRFKIGNLESKGTLIETECAHLLGHIDTVFISLRRALQIWYRLQDKEAIHSGNLPTFLVPFSPGDNIWLMMASGGGYRATSWRGRCKLLVGHRVRGRWTTACF